VGGADLVSEPDSRRDDAGHHKGHTEIVEGRGRMSDGLLPRRAPQQRRDLALALVVARRTGGQLATARMLDSATATHLRLH
jgi:hypothetical protein